MIDASSSPADAGEDASAGAGPELLQVPAQQPGQRRGDGYPAPFPHGTGLEVPLFAAGAVVGPFGAHLGRGRAEPQLSPAVGGFLPFACGVIPDERRERDVVLAENDGFFRA